jgi:hypothetical protein
VVPNRWYHLAVTKQRFANKLASTTLYIDGTPVPLSVRQAC